MVCERGKWSHPNPAQQPGSAAQAKPPAPASCIMPSAALLHALQSKRHLCEGMPPPPYPPLGQALSSAAPTHLAAEVVLVVGLKHGHGVEAARTHRAERQRVRRAVGVDLRREGGEDD